MSLPLPPQDIANRTPLCLTLASGTVLSRFFMRVHDPVYFDRSASGRLNAPDGRYGVFYAAVSRRGSFAETFLRRPGNVVIASDFIAARAHAAIRVLRNLRLVQLYGNGLARLGATAEVTHRGLPYTLAQSWSAALHAHPGNFDGIAYTARHNDEEICVALFDRAVAAIAAEVTDDDLDQDWFYALVEHHGVGIAPSET